MVLIRKADERGQTKLPWLDSRHSFSFGDYYDPGHMGFRALRVINEDRVAPGGGFGLHPHRDMEIVTYVLNGAVEHKDSLGSGGIIRQDELQHMSAGTGIQHSEFNASKTEPVHLYQIWLLPERRGLKPSYEQKAFPQSGRQGKLRSIANRTGADGALRIHQDAQISLASLGPDVKLHWEIVPGRHAWVQVLRGDVELNGHSLGAGDAVALSEEHGINVASQSAAEIMLFDLA